MIDKHHLPSHSYFNYFFRVYFFLLKVIIIKNISFLKKKKKKKKFSRESNENRMVADRSAYESSHSHFHFPYSCFLFVSQKDVRSKLFNFNAFTTFIK